jgi:dethiobiotin synthetase
MKNCFFITGTGTSVGKTTVSAILCVRHSFDYWKPVQTGQELDREYVENYAKKYNKKIVCYKEAYHFLQPASPHIAAKSEGAEIEIDKIIPPKKENLIIEGAGGLLVPLNNQFFIVDLIRKFSIPAIIVSENILGTINHTLLTIEALRTRNIKIEGVIMNRNSHYKENALAIERYSAVKVIDFIDDIK